ncbi:hypothetical protein [Eubacterium callanderi]|uniref:hypothetical protein n=1 Tax=Eubacterium callanderi TaxID=53442 RepID=UPI001AA18F64|nr:hypothetical protein [Eubacterium callanderi]MBO1703361.1 hypothetical protein [Eubacterium callanderi]
MKKKFNETSASFMFKFDGDNEIDAKSLSRSLELVANTFSYITNTYDDSSYMKMRVAAIRPGSFVIDFNVLVEATLTILCSPGASIALESIKTFIELLKIKTAANGKPVERIKTDNGLALIKLDDGSTMSVGSLTLNIFENSPTVDENLSEIASLTLKENKDGIIVQSDEDSFLANRNDLRKISKIVHSKENEKTLDQIIDINLPLKKPDLTGNSCWDFHYGGRTIHAKIEDSSFLEKVHTHKIRDLYAGVQLPVKLRIITVLDSYGIPIEDSDRYIVMQITGNPILPEDMQEKQLNYIDKL